MRKHLLQHAGGFAFFEAIWHEGKREGVAAVARRPLIWFAVCWLAGVSAGSVGTWRHGMLFIAGWGLLVAAAALFRLLPGKLALACAAALLAGMGARLWSEAGQTPDIADRLNPEEAMDVYLGGTVHSAVNVDGDTVRFVLLAREVVTMAEPGSGPGEMALAVREKVQVRLRLNAEEELPAAQAMQRGDPVTIRGMLGRPDDAGNFGAFDYRAYLERQGIRWVLTAKGRDAVGAWTGRAPWTVVPLAWADRVRALTGALMDRLYPGGDAGYMKGLVAGIQSDVDPALYDTFSRLGLTHVLAISGMHVGVVALLLLQFGRVLRLTRERSYDLVLAAIPPYILFTGASPSAVRAGIMGMLALRLARQNRLKDGLHLLAAAAVAMTAWQPAIVENLSFLLSAIVTGGLLLFVPMVHDWLPLRPKWLRGALAVTLVAQAVSFPLTAHYFHQFHLLSPLANLLLASFISVVVMPLGLASLVLAAVWFPLGTVPAALASWCNRGTFALADWLVRADRFRTIWPETPPLWVVSGYALLGATCWAIKAAKEHGRPWRQTFRPAASGGVSGTATAGIAPSSFSFPARRQRARHRRLSVATAAVLALLWTGFVAWGGFRNPWDRTAAVMFLDVGQGDAVLVRTGSGRHLLIDAGGTVTFHKPGDEWRERTDPFEVGKDVLIPLLRKRGVRTLEALVLTHLDADHIGGAEAVLNEVRVKRLIMNGTYRRNERTERLFRLALRKGVPIYAARAGMRWAIDDSVVLDVLHPFEAPPRGVPLPEEERQNDRSVVLALNLYGRQFLLPGDLGASGERRVLAALDAAPPRADVLKAGHHGSRSSNGPEWLTVWRPREAVISVGRHNLYGHPHPDTVQRLTAAGAAVFRTDRHGEIQYRVTPDGRLERRVKRPLADGPGMRDRNRKDLPGLTGNGGGQNGGNLLD